MCIFGGIWSQVISNATPSDVAYNPENVDPFDTNTPYEAGMPALTDDGSEHKQVIIASSIMQGAFSNSQDYTASQIVQEGESILPKSMQQIGQSQVMTVMQLTMPET